VTRYSPRTSSRIGTRTVDSSPRGSRTVSPRTRTSAPRTPPSTRRTPIAPRYRSGRDAGTRSITPSGNRGIATRSTPTREIDRAARTGGRTSLKPVSPRTGGRTVGRRGRRGGIAKTPDIVRRLPVSNRSIARASGYLGGKSASYYRHSYLGIGVSLGLSWGIGYWDCDYYSGIYRYCHFGYRLPYYYGCYRYGPAYYRPYWAKYWLCSFYPIYYDPYYCYLSWGYGGYYVPSVSYTTNNYYYGDEGGAVSVARDTAPPSSTSAYRASTPEALAAHYVELGDLYMKTRRYERAVESYTRAVRLVDDDGSLRFVLADALFQVGRYDEAAFQIRQGIYLDPELAKAIVDKLSFYDWPGDFEKQMTKLRKRVADNPFDSQARLVLAYNERFTNHFDVAKKELTTLSEQMPGDPTVEALLAAIDDAKARFEKSAKKPEPKPVEDKKK